MKELTINEPTWADIRLDRCFKAWREYDECLDRTAFLMRQVFSCFTYDPEMDDFLCAEFVDICIAISTSQTLGYFSRGNSYRVIYTMAMHLPWFSDNTEYGTSIRFPWWQGVWTRMSEDGKACRIKDEDMREFSYAMKRFLNKLEMHDTQG